MRPTFSQIYLDLAKAFQSRSTCLRAQVGCVITDLTGRYVYAVGYNGGASGLVDFCRQDEPGGCGCVHAEMNAVVNCQAPRSEEKIVYTTHSPCELCAKMLINLGGVQRVEYLTEYRVPLGRILLASAGIELISYHPYE